MSPCADEMRVLVLVVAAMGWVSLGWKEQSKVAPSFVDSFFEKFEFPEPQRVLGWR